MKKPGAGKRTSKHDFLKTLFDNDPRGRINVEPADAGTKRCGYKTKTAFTDKIFACQKVEYIPDQSDEICVPVLMGEERFIKKIQSAVDIIHITCRDGGENVFTQFSGVGELGLYIFCRSQDKTFK